MNEHAKKAVENIIKGDNVGFMKEFEQLIVDKLHDNEEFQSLRNEFEKYNSIVTQNDDINDGENDE